MTTHLHTTRIDSLEGRNALLPVLNDWSKELVTIQARVPKNDIRQKALSNLNDMIFRLKKDIFKYQKTDTPYIAKDGKGIIQAIATRHYSKKWKHYVELVATKPTNLHPIGTQKAVRGAGTAVIRHIVHDVLKQIQSKKERGPEPSLLLNSVPLAVGFYKKLGFEEDKDPRTKISNDLITMKLSVNKMKKLLKRDSTAIILFSENVARTANKAL